MTSGLCFENDCWISWELSSFKLWSNLWHMFNQIKLFSLAHAMQTACKNCVHFSSFLLGRGWLFFNLRFEGGNIDYKSRLNLFRNLSDWIWTFWSVNETKMRSLSDLSLCFYLYLSSVSSQTGSRVRRKSDFSLSLDSHHEVVD